LSVDEKPTIQALERARGYVLTSSGKVVQGLKRSTYKRHGTVNLFAALEVATGLIRGKTTQTKKRVDFQAFMTELVAEHPPDREIHVILDNLSTHKKNDDWLAAHPNVTFHFTPTSASWLNQVEIWFGIFTRKALPAPALPASSNSPRRSATSPKPTTATPPPSSGASAR
jgi:transposase